MAQALGSGFAEPNRRHGVPPGLFVCLGLSPGDTVDTKRISPQGSGRLGTLFGKREGPLVSGGERGGSEAIGWCPDWQKSALYLLEMAIGCSQLNRCPIVVMPRPSAGRCCHFVRR